ncbi:hypothetical protein [Anatilimnocola floriformis]|uniref:hypothetical protein n=1 Tax=Anatilimnocola floriformis TaxID=2948575 RepID=UPI0020C558D3|nr:hypothetical protein [Anatilimnocola floriformis]
MKTANPVHFIGGLFLEFGAAAAAIAVLWPTHKAEVLPPPPQPVEWSMSQPAPLAQAPIYFQNDAFQNDAVRERESFATRPLLPPAPAPRSAESDRYFVRNSFSTSDYRPAEPLPQRELPPAYSQRETSFSRPQTAYSQQQPNAYPQQQTNYSQQQTAVARPRVRTFANDQYSPAPAYRTAERLDDNYHSRY